LLGYYNGLNNFFWALEPAEIIKKIKIEKKKFFQNYHFFFPLLELTAILDQTKMP